MKKGVFSRQIAKQFNITNNYDEFIISRLSNPSSVKPILFLTVSSPKGVGQICLFPSTVRKIYSGQLNVFQNCTFVKSTILFVR